MAFFMTMVLAFVLISTATAKEHTVYDELMQVGEISELYPLFGEYDFIAKVEAKNEDDIGDVVVNQIRRLEGVSDTKTLTVVSL
jgi:DNA-binding Lrp family transcriptional regulator